MSEGRWGGGKWRASGFLPSQPTNWHSVCSSSGGQWCGPQSSPAAPGTAAGAHGAVWPASVREAIVHSHMCLCARVCPSRGCRRVRVYPWCRAVNWARDGHTESQPRNRKVDQNLKSGSFYTNFWSVPHGNHQRSFIFSSLWTLLSWVHSLARGLLMVSYSVSALIWMVAHFSQTLDIFTKPLYVGERWPHTPCSGGSRLV